MTVVPDIQAKLLGKSIPGELIRFKFRGRMLLGIVAGCDFLRIPSDKVIVVLEDIPDRPGSAGKFLPMGDYMMAETCLSFGTSHIVVVHPEAPTAPDGDERFDLNGVLQVGDDGRAIRSHSAQDTFNDYTLIIDLGSWKAVQPIFPHSRPRRIAVLAWELRLITDVPLEPPLSPVFGFAAGG